MQKNIKCMYCIFSVQTIQTIAFYFKEVKLKVSNNSSLAKLLFFSSHSQKLTNLFLRVY